MRIVSIAVKEYFVNSKPIEETIKNHKNIYDFCLRLKTNSKSTPKLLYLHNGKLEEQILNRTTRYYVSNKGGALIKDFGEGRQSGVNVGYNVTIFNKYIEKDIKDYDLNYSFYIAEAKKLINAVEQGNQLTLF